MWASERRENIEKEETPTTPASMAPTPLRTASPQLFSKPDKRSINLQGPIWLGGGVYLLSPRSLNRWLGRVWWLLWSLRDCCNTLSYSSMMDEGWGYPVVRTTKTLSIILMSLVNDIPTQPLFEHFPASKYANQYDQENAATHYCEQRSTAERAWKRKLATLLSLLLPHTFAEISKSPSTKSPSTYCNIASTLGYVIGNS